MRDALKATKATDEATAAKDEGAGSDVRPGETGDAPAEGPRIGFSRRRRSCSRFAATET